MQNVCIRDDDLELRSCNDHLLKDNEKWTTLEIVRWNNNYCYVVAYFEVDKEGLDGDLTFVGGRPFDSSIDVDSFWQLARLGYKILVAKLAREYDE